MLGNRLKEVRENRGLSQLEVAESVGITRYLMSKYENNISVPRGRVLVELAKLYNVSVEYLMGTSKDTPLIDYYRNILDPSSISKINPCSLKKGNGYFAISSNFNNHFGINDKDILIFAQNSTNFDQKIVLVSYLSTELLLGFLWAKNGIKMLSIKNDHPPIDISNEQEYKILGYLVKSIRNYGDEND